MMNAYNIVLDMCVFQEFNSIDVKIVNNLLIEAGRRDSINSLALLNKKS